MSVGYTTPNLSSPAMATIKYESMQLKQTKKISLTEYKELIKDEKEM